MPSLWIKIDNSNEKYPIKDALEKLEFIRQVNDSADAAGEDTTPYDSDDITERLADIGEHVDQLVMIAKEEARMMARPIIHLEPGEEVCIMIGGKPYNLMAGVGDLRVNLRHPEQANSFDVLLQNYELVQDVHIYNTRGNSPVVTANLRKGSTEYIVFTDGADIVDSRPSTNIAGDYTWTDDPTVTVE